MKAAHVNSSYAVCGAEGPAPCAFANPSQRKHRSLGGNALRPHKLRSYCARLVFRVPCWSAALANRFLQWKAVTRAAVKRTSEPQHAPSTPEAALALAAESHAGLTLQALGVGLPRAAQRNRPPRGLSGRPRIRGIAPLGTRRLPIDPDARARRNRGRLSESHAGGQQGQDSNGREDSTDFHCNVLSF